MIKRIIFPDLPQKISQSPNFRNAMNLKQHRTIVQMLFYCRIIVLFLAISCSDDDNGPDLREPFIGTYQVDEFIPPATTVSNLTKSPFKGNWAGSENRKFPGLFCSVESYSERQHPYHHPTVTYRGKRDRNRKRRRYL